jgi:HAD superfamily hydrolase (TIGR01509 family)
MSPAVILDVDGTLVDSNDAHAEAWVAAFNEAGIDVSYVRVRRAIGMGGDKLMPHVGGITADSPRGRQISERRGQIFVTDFLPHIQPFPRVRDLVQRFRMDGFTVVIASSANATELDALLEIAGIADLITSTTSSDDAKRSKPDPDIVQAALKQSGAGREAAAMIGDTPYDVEAARRAGIAIVGVESGGWTPPDLAGAIEVHPGVAELYASYADSIVARLTDGSRRTA